MVITSLRNICGHLFHLSLNTASDRIKLILENRDSNEKWQCSYSNHDIEELTKKTGCFKRFSTFVSMLEASFKQNNDSVFLDILTHFDLEKLREEKFGHKYNDNGLTEDNSKMFLVLTHCDYFGSKVHYPLSVSLCSHPGVKEPLKNLENEINSIKYQNYENSWKTDLKELKREVERLKKEKLEIGAAFIAYKQETGAQSAKKTKEINRLNKLVARQNEELNLNSERYLKDRKGKSEECRSLKTETDRLRSSERDLRVKVQKLNTELTLFRRSRSEQRSYRDSSLESRSRLHPSSLPSREPFRRTHSTHSPYRASSSSPLQRKAFSSPSRSRHPPTFHPPFQRPTRSPLRSSSSLLSRLTRPTSSSSLKQVHRQISPHYKSKYETVFDDYNGNNFGGNYRPNKGSVMSKGPKSSGLNKRGKTTKISPSSSLSSITSSYSSACILNRTRKSKNTDKQRSINKMTDDDDFGSSTNADEFAEIDARLTKLKRFMDQNL